MRQVFQTSYRVQSIVAYIVLGILCSFVHTNPCSYVFLGVLCSPYVLTSSSRTLPAYDIVHCLFLTFV